MRKGVKIWVKDRRERERERKENIYVERDATVFLDEKKEGGQFPIPFVQHK